MIDFWRFTQREDGTLGLVMYSRGPTLA